MFPGITSGYYFRVLLPALSYNRKMKTVCVLFGGVSTEHLISGRSAFNIIGGLRKANYHVVRVGITKQGQWIRYDGEDRDILEGTWENTLPEAAGPLTVAADGKGVSVKSFLASVIGCTPDVIFPAVHGINCEDGTLQGLLELSGIPYVGCGVLASAAGMDKLHAKRVFQSAKIPQCKYLAVTRKEVANNMDAAIRKIEKKVGYPCFLKPNNGGSSVGTRSAKNKEELAEALQDVARYDRIILIEEFIPCREIEAAVMGNEQPKVAMLGEVLTAENIEYYDYETKYFDPNGATVCLPAALPVKTANSITKYAKKAYQALSCAGLSRVDFFIDRRNDKVYINEINTLPGFTPISLFPKAWNEAGIPIDKLVKKLCDLAISEKKSKKRLEILS